MSTLAGRREEGEGEENDDDDDDDIDKCKWRNEKMEGL